MEESKTGDRRKTAQKPVYAPHLFGVRAKLYAPSDLQPGIKNDL